MSNIIDWRPIHDKFLNRWTSANTFIDAVTSGETETVRKLLDSKTDVHVHELFSILDQALMAAALNGHTETACVLLQYKANVNACSEDGKPNAPLRLASMGGHLETVQVLLEHIANVQAVPYEFVQEFLFPSSSSANVNRLGFALRLGHYLRQSIPRFDHQSFQQSFKQFMQVSSSTTELCRDLCS